MGRSDPLWAAPTQGVLNYIRRENMQARSRVFIPSLLFICRHDAFSSCLDCPTIMDRKLALSAQWTLLSLHSFLSVYLSQQTQNEGVECRITTAQYHLFLSCGCSIRGHGLSHSVILRTWAIPLSVNLRTWAIPLSQFEDIGYPILNHSSLC